FGPPILTDVDGDGYPEILVAHGTRLGSPNPLLPASRGTTPSAGPAAEASRDTVVRRQLDGRLAASTTFDAGTSAFTGLDYYDVKLLAMRPDRAVVRSWRLLGANANQPLADARLLAGDFDRNGTLDVAAVYGTVLGGGINGYIVEGVVTVLTTGAPYSASDGDWPMLFQNPHNTAARLRTDVAAPAVSVTTPAAASVVTGPVTVSAQAADDVWVAGVQFQLDGADLGGE